MSKIGIVHYTAPPGKIAGVEVVIDYHSKILTKQGYNVHLIFGQGGGLDYENLEEHEVPLLSPENPRVQDVQKKILEKHEKTEEFEKLKNDIKKELKKIFSNLDCCIIHNIPSMSFNFAATAAINELADELENRFIFWLHDTIIVREGWQNYLDKFPVTLLHHKNGEITFVTPTTFRAKQFAELEEPYKIIDTKVVPNGISVEGYLKIDETTKQLMRHLGLSFNDFIIVTPVRVLPRKNIELALNVVHELEHISGETRIKLLITGPPGTDSDSVAYMAKLREIIRMRRLEDNVVFCHDLISFRRKFSDGKIVKWSVADAYNIADLIFVPSKEEGFGLPVIEAGAARKPVFCSRIPPFQELIREDIEGYMFDLRNPPQDIALRIYRNMLASVVDNNFAQVVEKYDWEAIVLKKIIPLL
ncbi:MAG: glycosyltransferase family 4 protein [Candidatus Bathyarchaeia archaeon]